MVPTSSPTVVSVEYLNVKDSKNLGTQIDLTGKNSTDGGNNSGWKFAASSSNNATQQATNAIDGVISSLTQQFQDAVNNRPDYVANPDAAFTMSINGHDVTLPYSTWVDLFNHQFNFQGIDLLSLASNADQGSAS